MNYIIKAYDKGGTPIRSWELGDRALSLRVEEGTIQAVAYSHAELTIEQSGGVRVTNVSGARAYLRELLQKSDERKWNVGEDLSFWDYTLRLESKSDDSGVAVTLLPANLTLRPGEKAKCEVELHYTGREDLKVGLKAAGFPENWLQCEPRRVSLNEANRTAHLTLTISVPKTIRQESNYDVTVTAIDEQTKRELGNELTEWSVIPASRLEILPTVRRRRFRANYKLNLRNARSRTIDYTLTGQCESDELNELELLFAKEKEKNLVAVPLELKPGEEQTVQLKIKSPARWRGGDRRHNFSLLAQPDEQGADDAAETIIANGEFVHRQVITMIEGLIMLGILALLGVAAHLTLKPKLELRVKPSTLVNPKSPVILEWNAPRARQIKIVEPVEVYSNAEIGSHTFEEGFDGGATILVTVVASNFFGSKTEKATVKVKVKDEIPPRILLFKASPEAVEINGTVELSWKAENAKSCELVGVKDQLPAEGSEPHQPEQTREYELICKSRSGESASRKLTVRVLPKITSFNIPEWKDAQRQKPFRPGDPITVQWEVLLPGESQQPPTVSLRFNGQTKQLSGPSGTETLCLGSTGNANVTLVVRSDNKEIKSTARTVRFDNCSGLERLCPWKINCPKCSCPQQ